MKVILQESYMSLGEAGDIVDVRPGYARNFLLPQKLAVSATQGNLKRFQDQVKEITTKKEKERDNSKKTLEILEKLQLTLKKKVSEEGKLFGSITTKELEAEFVKNGATVDRRQIVLGRQIKMIGDYSILVKLVGGMKATVPLKVAPDAPLKGAAAMLEAELMASAAAAAPAPKAKTKKDEKSEAKSAESDDENDESTSTEE